MNARITILVVVAVLASAGTCDFVVELQGQQEQLLALFDSLVNNNPNAGEAGNPSDMMMMAGDNQPPFVAFDGEQEELEDDGLLGDTGYDDFVMMDGEPEPDDDMTIEDHEPVPFAPIFNDLIGAISRLSEGVQRGDGYSAPAFAQRGFTIQFGDDVRREEMDGVGVEYYNDDLGEIDDGIMVGQEQQGLNEGEEECPFVVACQDDVVRFCVADTEGVEVAECLLENRHELTDECLSFIIDAGNEAYEEREQQQEQQQQQQPESIPATPTMSAAMSPHIAHMNQHAAASRASSIDHGLVYAGFAMIAVVAISAAVAIRSRSNMAAAKRRTLVGARPAEVAGVLIEH